MGELKSKLKILFLIVFFVFIVYPTIVFSYENKGKSFKEREYEREHTTSAIKYLRMALIELQSISGTSNIEEQLENLIKYLSVKNLDGDYFSQYARQNSNIILEDIKKEYLVDKTADGFNRKVLMEKRIYDKINNANNYNFQSNTPKKDSGKGIDNERLNKDIINSIR